MGLLCGPPARGQPGRVGQERVMQHQVGVAPTHIAPVRSCVPLSCKGWLRVLTQPVPDNSIAIRNRSALARRLDSPLRPQSTVPWDRNSSYRPLRVVLRRQLRASIAPVRPLVISLEYHGIGAQHLEPPVLITLPKNQVLHEILWDWCHLRELIEIYPFLQSSKKCPRRPPPRPCR